MSKPDFLEAFNCGKWSFQRPLDQKALWQDMDLYIYIHMENSSLDLVSSTRAITARFKLSREERDKFIKWMTAIRKNRKRWRGKHFTYPQMVSNSFRDELRRTFKHES